MTEKEKCHLSGTPEPYEKILIPFTGGPGSLVLLVEMLRRRKDIYLFYLRDLYAWNDEKELKQLKKVIACFSDYWKDHLNNKLFVYTLTAPDKRLLCEGFVTEAAKDRQIREKILITKCYEMAEKNELHKVILPKSFSPESSSKTEYVEVPCSMVERINIVDDRIHLYPEMLDPDYLPSDVWKWCRVCRSSFVSSDKTEDDFEGCCDDRRCTDCILFKRSICNIQNFEPETPMGDVYFRKKKTFDRKNVKWILLRNCYTYLLTCIMQKTLSLEKPMGIKNGNSFVTIWN